MGLGQRVETQAAAICVEIVIQKEHYGHCRSHPSACEIECSLLNGIRKHLLGVRFLIVSVATSAAASMEFFACVSSTGACCSKTQICLHSQLSQRLGKSERRHMKGE